ncbi:type 4 pilus major pilin [Escherichia coli]|uniref:type 4 pilus major pilin n=1 Tax=Escherichia coli TaxID=562 RepID=UPI000F422AEC|nr:type 4 pilus major pilin [Escherichia coli]EEV8848763.1 prepilin-type N-terminal cleavage/methylation domain-containing protein [Escherichia coli]MBF5695260.1 prepilin-type N-terminal cleavage/methylation domain-containing protein [Escherichia coli]RNI67322.1 prepilin-type N-terminal cleavage/methylation domain-containing protein [Escherichia coli]RNJ13287.1 prepilin-type N-terminal cleavage/methylation domain-containing protein [Escherichia coli]
MSVITGSYSEHNIRHLQNDDKGMTLLEVLGVLVVAAIVIGAVMGLMSDTLSSSDNQKELKNLQTIATKMKAQKFQGQYTGKDYIKILTESGGLPADMIAGNNKAKNAWGGEVTIKPNNNNYSYTIESKDIPKKNCIDLVTSLRSSSMFTKINSTETSKVDPSTVCNADKTTIKLETNS